jgi:hypothetical protein
MKSRRLVSIFLPWLVLAAGVLLLAAMNLGSLPGGGASMAPDYGLHLPNLLAGYFYFLANGALSPPWFSPAQCGGVPFLADLNVAYYSVPQWLGFAVGPIAAIQATFITFAAAGAAGMYLLGRSRFGLSVPAALVAAVLFLFNSFYVHRMAVGHLTFHPFMLTPWLSWLVLPPDGHEGDRWPWPRLAAAVVGVALIFAYAFQAGMVHLVAPAALATAAIVLVHAYLNGASLRPWILLSAGAVLAVMLSAQRVAAALAFATSFPRDLYPLPGFASLFEPAWLVARALFWNAPHAEGVRQLTNSKWALDRHEWEYGVGPAAAVLLAVGLAAMAVAAARRGGVTAGRLRRGLALGLPLAALLALPLIVNWYEPGWNAILKKVPVLGSSVTMIRWFAMYIPVVALACGLATERVSSRSGTRWAILSAVIVATGIWHWTVKPGEQTGYDASVVVEAWSSVHGAADIPPISRIGVIRGEDGSIQAPVGRNDAMVYGQSQLACYQPIFGYGLEAFPLGPMRPGIILRETSAGLNMKNPVCYLFPAENGCEPGGHFRRDQVDTVIAFAQYQAFPFNRSATQVAADAINLAALIGIALLLAAAALAHLLSRRGVSRTPETETASSAERRG